MAAAGFPILDPTVADMVDEAFERAGIDPASLGDRHIQSARRSMGLLISEWATLGLRQYTKEVFTANTVIGQNYFALPARTIDVLDVFVRRDAIDYPLLRISHTDYNALPSKFSTGRADRYYVERLRLLETLYFWQAPENTTDQFHITLWKHNEDAATFGTALPISMHGREAFTAGMAAKLAQKHNFERYPALQMEYAGPDISRPIGKLRAFIEEDRERAPVTFTLAYR